MGLPDKWWIAAGCSTGFIVAAFFLAGAHHEIRHQLWMRKRQRQRGGWM